MDSFSKPTVECRERLHDHGATWINCGRDVTTKVYMGLVSCDSVGRPLLQNMKQFNGEYGCGFCRHSGCIVAKGQGYSRSYAQSVAGLPEERNHAQMLQHAETALHSGSVEFGIRVLASCRLCLNLMWCEHLCQITCIVCCKQITILLTASPPPAGYIQRLADIPNATLLKYPATCVLFAQ